MASTYSPNLRLELIGTGEQQGQWGSTTNTNLGTLLEQAIGGYETVTVSDSGDTTLTANNGSADQSRNMVLNLTGTLSAARNVICPAIEKLYVVKNATTGGYAVTFKVNGQTGIAIPNGQTVFLYVDGTDARQITGSLAAQSANNVSITGGSISNATLSNVSASNSTVSNSTLSNVTVVANASSLGVRDSDGSHVLSIAAGSNLTANRVFTLTTGDAARTLTVSANATVSQDYSTTGNPQFATIELGDASDTTLSRSAAGILAVEGVTVPLNSITNTHTAQDIELGDVSDTTITRVSAGKIAVEGQNVLLTGTTDNITKGFTVTPNNIGTVSSGTTTPDPANGNYQYYTNNGAHTLAAPSSDCAIDILVTNGASAGAITFSGFTVGSSTGSTYNTTNTNKFILSIRRINAVSTYGWYALQ